LLNNDVAHGRNAARASSAAATPGSTVPLTTAIASGGNQDRNNDKRIAKSAAQRMKLNHEAANFDCRSRMQALAASDAGNMNIAEPLR